MPGFIKTPKDESKWKEAKEAAAKEAEKGSDHYWALANVIWHKMKKSSDLEKSQTSPKLSSLTVKNPSKVGSTAVKMPKASKLPDAFGKPSLFFKNEESQSSLDKLSSFLESRKSKK